MKVYGNDEPRVRWLAVKTEAGELAQKYWISLDLENILAEDNCFHGKFLGLHLLLSLRSGELPKM